MTSAQSVFPSDMPGADRQSAIGQFNVRATALQMAMVSAAIANGGVYIKPYLVDELLGPDLRCSTQTKPTELRRAVSPQVAAELTEMMVRRQHGTGTTRADPGVSVAGKTGTAQNAAGAAPHAWFVAFAPASPKVAVAVIVENGGGNRRSHRRRCRGADREGRQCRPTLKKQP